MQRLMFYTSILAGLVPVLCLGKGYTPVALTAVSLGFALLHFAATGVFLWMVQSPYRWFILLWTAVIFLIFLDDSRQLWIAWEFRHEQA